jgi:ankyrin repeat protein
LCNKENILINNNSGILGTPLHVACKKNKFEIVKILLKFNADVDLLDINGFLPEELTSSKRIMGTFLNIRKKCVENNQIFQLIESKITKKYSFLEIFRFLPVRPSKATGIVKIMGGLIFNYNKRYIELDPVIGSLRIFKNINYFPHSPMYKLM